MGILQTSVSGMKAQANRLNAVSQNIANASTIGYKRVATEFADLVLGSSKGSYNGGGVQTIVRNLITQSGGYQGTASATDIAIQGNGFFLVQDANGRSFLTRAGSFVPDGEGNLVNSAGYYLLGYNLVGGNINPSVTLNSILGAQSGAAATSTVVPGTATTSGTFAANLPSNAPLVSPVPLPPTLVQDFGDADLSLGGSITLAVGGIHAGDSGVINFTDETDLINQLNALGGVASATFVGNELTIVGAETGATESLDITAVGGLFSAAAVPASTVAVNTPAAGDTVTPPTLVQNLGNADLSLGGSITLAVGGTHAGDSSVINFTSQADLLNQLNALGGIGSASIAGGVLTIVGEPGAVAATDTLDITAVANLFASAAVPATTVPVNNPQSGVDVADSPAANSASSVSTAVSSVLVYDSRGEPVTLDIHLTKTASSPTGSTWEIAVFDRAGASTGPGAPFPYSGGVLATSTLNFNTSGALTSSQVINVPVPGGTTVAVNIGGLQESASPYAPLAASFDGTPATTSLSGQFSLQRVNVNAATIQATPSTHGVFQGNVDANAAVVTPVAGAVALPSANNASSVFTSKASLDAYDNLGGAVTLDLYFTKTGNDTWEITAFNKADSTSGDFPYSSAPLVSGTFAFSGSTGALLTTPAELNLTIPGGQAFTLDLSGLSQLKQEFTPVFAGADGNPPSVVSDVVIGADGVVSLLMSDGTTRSAYRIALADVPSPDLLATFSGSVFSPTLESGDVFVGFPNTGRFGSIAGSTLEASNVDLADELATMIEAQRNYTANSKAFQTGSELLEVLVNLKR
ncbi:flagellar hook-basal body complex protein [Pseudochelatococcus sp. B33]